MVSKKLLKVRKKIEQTQGEREGRKERENSVQEDGIYVGKYRHTVRRGE